MRSRFSLRLLLPLAAVAFSLSAGAAWAGVAKPVDRTQYRRPTAVHVDTSACPGFASVSPLVLKGTLSASYADYAGHERKGRVDLGASATANGRTYRVHERYLFRPRGSFELVFGWGTTRITRDDGASITGFSSFGIIPEQNQEDWISWLGSPPVCAPARH